ncbi:MAG: polymerase, sigma-24 subunit, subfamily [Pedosphaera sp.]|nr:polymerase, sigma-24 subunit, subfamily [Pedosphaera sp.]
MNDVNELIPTRQSLLSRLKDWNDQESWKVFFDTYWRLIYGAALKAGLNDAEAQDVVQDTVISVLKSMPGFEYDTEKGSFKGWLLRLTSWRIADQARKRQKGIEEQPRDSDTSTKTEHLERLADPVGIGLEATWDEEWEKNLMAAAVDRVKKKVDPKQYQIFDLYVLKQWPVTKVARTLKVNPGRVYLIKHRIGNLIKKEVAYLRSKPI